MSYRFTTASVAVMGALLFGPIFAQEENLPPPPPSPDTPNIGELVPEDVGGAVRFKTDRVGEVHVVYAGKGLFDVQVNLEPARKIDGKMINTLTGKGRLQDFDPNHGDCAGTEDCTSHGAATTLYAKLYPDWIARALPTDGLTQILDPAGSDAAEAWAGLSERDERTLMRRMDKPIEMWIKTDGTRMEIICPTVLGHILIFANDLVFNLVYGVVQLGKAIAELARVVAAALQDLFVAVKNFLHTVFIKGVYGKFLRPIGQWFGREFGSTTKTKVIEGGGLEVVPDDAGQGGPPDGPLGAEN